MMDTKTSSQNKKRIADNSRFWSGMAAVLAPMSDCDCQCLGIAIAERMDADKREKAKAAKTPKIAER
jgi:hypothetical protein